MDNPNIRDTIVKLNHKIIQNKNQNGSEFFVKNDVKHVPLNIKKYI